MQLAAAVGRNFVLEFLAIVQFYAFRIVGDRKLRPRIPPSSSAARNPKLTYSSDLTLVQTEWRAGFRLASIGIRQFTGHTIRNLTSLIRVYGIRTLSDPDQ